MEIYIIEKLDDVIYVGKSVNGYNRWRCSHRKKWGYDTKVSIIDVIPDNEWKFWEKFYISLYKSWGFILKNRNNGGGGPDRGRKLPPRTQEHKDKLRKGRLGCIHSQESKDKMRQSKLGKPSTFKNHNHNEKTKNLIREKKEIPVYQYNLNGDFIYKWKSAKFAGLQLNICGTTINRCSCNYKGNRTAGGFFWSKLKIKPLPLSPIIGKKVKKIDIEGKELEIYNSCKEAARKNNVSIDIIIYSCKNHQNKKYKKNVQKTKYQYV